MVDILDKNPIQKEKAETKEEISEYILNYIAEKIKDFPEEAQEREALRILNELGTEVILLDDGSWYVAEYQPKTKDIENSKKEETKIEKEEEEDWVAELSKTLLEEVKDLPDEEKEKGVIKILKEKYNLEIETLEGGEWALMTYAKEEPEEIKIIEERKEEDKAPVFGGTKNKEIPDIKGLLIRAKNYIPIPRFTLKTVIKITAITALVASMITAPRDKESQDQKNIEIEASKKKEIEKKLKDVMINVEKKWEAEKKRIEALGRFKEMVAFLEKKNLTPGEPSIILDKKSTKLFVLDKNFNLIDSIPVGIGTDPGEEKNTSISFKQGIRTTPAGAYMMSGFNTPEDEKSYGENSFQLWGISILGDTIELGLHPIYKPEFEQRRLAIESPDPSDNRVSDGCINAFEEEIQKIIEKFGFKRDGSSVLYVLPEDGEFVKEDWENVMIEIKEVLEGFKDF